MDKPKKKISYNRKYLIGMTVILIVLVALSLIINSTFFENYYINKKLAAMVSAYSELNDISNEGDFESSSFEIRFKSICEKNNVSIVMLNSETQTLKSSTDDPQFLINQLLSYIFNKSNNAVDSLLARGKNYELHLVTDAGSGIEYIDMFGVLDTGNLFLVRSPLAGIRESVRIASRFFNVLMVIFAVIVVAIFMFLSRRVSISELKEANERLKQDIEEKEKIEKIRSEFLSNVSHELKTPIALVQGYAEGLKEGMVDEPSTRDYYCEVIMDEASKMNSIVKRLIELSHIEFGDIEFDNKPFDLNELIECHLQSMQILCEQKEVNVSFDNPYGETVVVADEYYIEEVFNNFFTNALNYCSGDKNIRISLSKDNDRVTVSLFNSGDNIPQESIEHIWDQFYKVDKARTREYGGTGVGLSYVKAILDAIGQKYGVKNEQDGVTFYFTLSLFKNDEL